LVVFEFLIVLVTFFLALATTKAMNLRGHNVPTFKCWCHLQLGLEVFKRL
jgi:hypothetical protein